MKRKVPLKMFFFFCLSCKICFVGCPHFTKQGWYTLQFNFCLGCKRAFGTFCTCSNDSSAHTPTNLTLILLQAHTRSYNLLIFMSYKNVLNVHITYSAPIYLKTGKFFNSLCSSHNYTQFSIHFTRQDHRNYLLKSRKWTQQTPWRL